MIHDYGYVAEDYQEEMEKWTDPNYYDEEVRKIQLPFTAAPTPVASGLALEQQQQRRRENVKRLVEINAKKREERVRFFHSPVSDQIELLKMIVNLKLK